jgi:hypothetical protein
MPENQYQAQFAVDSLSHPKRCGSAQISKWRTTLPTTGLMVFLHLGFLGVLIMCAHMSLDCQAATSFDVLGYVHAGHPS